MKNAFKILCAVGLIGLLYSIIWPTVAWTGGTTAHVKITVLDDETDRPISNATVWIGEAAIENYNLTDPKDREMLVGEMGLNRTDATGTCTVRVGCGAGGGGGLFGLSGNYYLEGPVVIRAENHGEFRSLIQNIIGKKRFRLSDRKHEITIYLQSLKRAHR
jgi:hypothetical protein